MYRVIVNPGSGKGGGKKIGVYIAKTLKSKNLEFELFETEYKGHAKELAADFKDGVIIAVGGDGTFHEVLNGMDIETCALGFIPCGRGNDFAETLGLSKKPETALNDILSGEKINIDYIALENGLRCLNVCGTGLDVAVVERVENKKDSKFTYLASLIACIMNFKPYELDIKSEGIEEHYSCIMAGVCNGKQFGGGIKLSPLSSLTDGKLDVITMVMPKSKRILGAIMNFAAGKHMKKPYTHHFACEEVSITSPYNYPLELDGEIYRDVPLICKVVKGGLTTFKPVAPVQNKNSETKDSAADNGESQPQNSTESV